ncbi:hypothetical protein CP533_6718 [Ophiocordyceps camponoti-saundersi (nom. inval.)]|nr:hypothetical protein CP533_6718 [Ophiocordyceps camponoti-saundersi (nom. inval.)]
MWDVVWTDPGRELVGERRARREVASTVASTVDGGRTSLSSSTTSSPRSSTAESAFARFRARGLKQQGRGGATNSKPSPALPSPASACASSTTTTASARSSVSVVAELVVPEVVEGVVVSRDVRHDTSNESSTRRRLARIISSPSSDTSSRFFDRPSPARSVFAEPLTPPRSPTIDSPRPCRHPDLPATPPRHQLLPTAKARPCSSSHPWVSAPAESQPQPQPQVVSSSNSSIICNSNRNSNSSSRRNSRRGSMSRESAGSLASTSTSEALRFWSPVDHEAFKQEIKTMATAPPAVALAKLKELMAAGEDEKQDQNQLEVDRLRWMFSVLLHLDVAAPRSGTVKRRSRLDTDNVHGIMALHESKASATYLAGLYPSKRIFHMSEHPVPHQAFENLQSLKVRGKVPSPFPVPPQLFEAVYAVTLPSLCSEQELRDLLRSVNISLKSQGTLSLRLIDPLPCAETLGRRMRSWLEEHLIANLERQGRCSRPTAQLPQLLGEASLRAPGSTLTTAKFYATAESVRRLAKDPDPAIERMQAERKVKAELRSLVGRMLWKEVWGEYVTAGSWWWEDEACVEECLELGTFWEYQLIEAVKDG